MAQQAHAAERWARAVLEAEVERLAVDAVGAPPAAGETAVTTAAAAALAAASVPG